MKETETNINKFYVDLQSGSSDVETLSVNRKKIEDVNLDDIYRKLKESDTIVDEKE